MCVINYTQLQGQDGCEEPVRGNNVRLVESLQPYLPLQHLTGVGRICGEATDAVGRSFSV